MRRSLHLVSAGGVVASNDGHGVTVILCRRGEPPRWSLPKGTPDDGETMEETAIREVREETGLDVRIDTFLHSIDYWFVRSEDGRRCHKTVHFYLMDVIGGSIDRPDEEFDEVRWMTAREALDTASYPNEVKVIEKALEVLSRKDAAR